MEPARHLDSMCFRFVSERRTRVNCDFSANPAQCESCAEVACKTENPIRWRRLEEQDRSMGLHAVKDRKSMRPTLFRRSEMRPTLFLVGRFWQENWGRKMPKYFPATRFGYGVVGPQKIAKDAKKVMRESLRPLRPSVLFSVAIAKRLLGCRARVPNRRSI